MISLISQAEKLSAFHDHCKHLEMARTFQAPMTTGNLLVRPLCFLTNFLSILGSVSLNPHDKVIVLIAELG
jgi:hypothetical protein